MQLDAPTLLVAAAAVSAVVGLVFVAAPGAGRSSRALRAWGAAMLLGTAGLAAQALPEGLVPRGVAEAVLVGATALAWATARAFDGYRTSRLLVALGPALSLLTAALGGSDALLALIATASGASYLGAAAAPLWRGRRAEPLPSRPFAAALLGLHALLFAARALIGGLALATGTADVDWRAALLLEAVLFQVATGLALLSLARERAERDAARALLAGRDAALAASAAKSRFAAHLSHELRTPLNGLLALAERLAAEPRLPPDAHSTIEAMSAAGRHLRAVIGDTLDLARIEAGRLDLALGPVPLDALLRECAGLTAPMAIAPGVTFPHVLAPDLPAVIEADATRLRQVLLNLLGNAARYAPAGSAVWLRARRGERPASLRIEVEDAGPGVPPERRHGLFSAFHQVEAPGTDRPRPGGTGLGLAVSAALVEAMGGRIGHAPAEGRGSIFWFEVPLRVAPRNPAAGPAGPATGPSGSPARPLDILIVDDVATNREVARALAGALGHRADTAADGPAALVALHHRGGYDAVLLDLDLPGGMDGLEVTRRIRAMGNGFRCLPVIAVTGWTGPEEIAAALEAGMDAHLTKPLDREALRKVLDTVAVRRPGPADQGGYAREA